MNEVLKCIDDYVIIPSVVSTINSRNDCEVISQVLFKKTSDLLLPLMTAPMSQIINEHNYGIFQENNIFTIIPRSVSLHTRSLFLDDNKACVALSLFEFNDFINRIGEFENFDINKEYKILIDCANGHMIQIYNAISTAKEIYNYLWVMIGNIANPETYEWIVRNRYPVDAVRLGIGNGCFTGSMKVKTKEGYKKIKDINTDDEVLTHTGEYHKVVNINSFLDHKEIIKINDIECTPWHKFLVINKEDQYKVDENNYIDNAYWCESELLDSERQLLIEIDKNSIEENKIIIKFLEIKKSKIYENNEKTYDIEVDIDHSYNINNIIVHNSICTTAANAAVHYPMASLIMKINKWREERKKNNIDNYEFPIIIADGGFKNFDEIIKSIAMGADFVMLGRIFAKAEEACGKIFTNDDGTRYREYYGMSTKRAQIEFGGSGNKTSEGIQTIVSVDYYLEKWIDNFKAYLKSTMSYVNSNNLDEFRSNAKFGEISLLSRKNYFK